MMCSVLGRDLWENNQVQVVRFQQQDENLMGKQDWVDLEKCQRWGVYLIKSGLGNLQENKCDA